MGLRRFIVFAITSAAITSALLVLWPLCISRPSAINKQNIVKIRNGMTLQEVEEILGGPARDEISGAKYVQWLPIMPLTLNKRGAEWIGPNAAVFVGLDDDNRVVCRGSGIVGFYDTPIHRIRRWLRL
jgi:hypothetical protein